MTYNGIDYDYLSFFESIKLRKKRYIVVLDEDIYVKKINVKSNEILSEDIEMIKEEFFGKDEEYLIDYSLNKKEMILYIYAIKGGIKVSKFCYRASKVKVIPLQIYIMRKLSKKIKDKHYKCMFKFRDTYYYYSVNEGFIEESYASKEIKALFDKISISENGYVLYVEKSINNLYLNDKAKVRELEVEGILNERIFA